MTDSLIERLRKLCAWGVPMVDGKSRTDGLMEAAATMAKQAERIADLQMEVSSIATKDATIKLQAARIADLEAEVLAEKEENRWAYINAAMEDFPSPTDPVRDAAGELLPISTAPQTGEQIIVALAVYGSANHLQHPGEYLRTEYAIAETSPDTSPWVDYDCGWASTDFTHWAPLPAAIRRAEGGQG
ncbi:hypothetical protein [Pseudooceanicola atlanticus]|uniref:hypothetical protein n=1 Tax=Pseudooceanicola atlanticus TaxID=1461694 RepID=UPI0023551787|nr:hypothetical protein [Pseudooceanicola atlanticus]